MGAVAFSNGRSEWISGENNLVNSVDSKTTLDWEDGRLIVTIAYFDGMRIRNSYQLGKNATLIFYDKKADETGHEWPYITWQRNGNKFELWDKPITQKQEVTEWHWENNEWCIKG